MEKQFLVFQYDSYYPAGGMSDLKESFDTLIEVEEYLKEHMNRYDFYDIYDRINGVSVSID
jgi:hypothetical protein